MFSNLDAQYMSGSYGVSMSATYVGNPGYITQEFTNYLPISINIDNKFGNILIIVSNKSPIKSEEGLAFVTVGIDEEGNLAYISIEPEDKELASFVSRIKASHWADKAS
ncbi:hypothetical protein [Caldivirga maquilingensis]|nr:hypothetical protein [Caldivirga maquilingensis]